MVKWLKDSNKKKNTEIVKSVIAEYAERSVLAWSGMRANRLHYILLVRLHKPLKLEMISQKNWIEVAEGIQVTEF